MDNVELSSRSPGVLLLAIGFILVVLMGALAAHLGPAMLHPGEYYGSTKFDGTAEQGEMILRLFGVIGLFGLIAIAHGFFILVTGRKSLAFTAITIAAAALLTFLSWNIVTDLKERVPADGRLMAAAPAAS